MTFEFEIEEKKLKIEEEKLKIEKKKLEIENSFFKKNAAIIITALIAAATSIISIDIQYFQNKIFQRNTIVQNEILQNNTEMEYSLKLMEFFTSHKDDIFNNPQYIKKVIVTAFPNKIATKYLEILKTQVTNKKDIIVYQKAIETLNYSNIQVYIQYSSENNSKLVDDIQNYLVFDYGYKVQEKQLKPYSSPKGDIRHYNNEKIAIDLKNKLTSFFRKRGYSSKVIDFKIINLNKNNKHDNRNTIEVWLPKLS